MGMIKKPTTTVVSTEVAPGTISAINTPPVENGTDAAIARLQQPKVEKPIEIKPYAPKVRDFDAEARGKTRCALFGQIACSPFLAGQPLRTIEDYIAAIIKVADAGVKYTFDE